ncbi:hypothetical protein BGX27_005113, partial [Mortierella sp. AM989]
MSEVSILSMKAVHMIASGVLYDYNADEEMVSTFNIEDILPKGFTLRDENISPILKVSPLPHGLQKEIEENTKGDLALLLSQGHLQFLTSKFLGSGGKRKEGAHPKWDIITHALQEQTDVDKLSKVPRGLSFTVNEYLRQYSTATSNIWEGSIYRKSLDYLLRVLLRLHLAPAREAHFWNSTAEKKKRLQEERPKTMTRKLWRWKSTRLFDELSNVIEMRGKMKEKTVEVVEVVEEKMKRISSIVSRLIKLHHNEPLKRNGGILPLETRIELQTDRKDEEDEDAIALAIDDVINRDDLEDSMDPDELRELELEEEVEPSTTTVQEPSRKRLRSLQ